MLTTLHHDLAEVEYLLASYPKGHLAPKELREWAVLNTKRQTLLSKLGDIEKEAQCATS